MNKILLILSVLFVGIFIAGCVSSGQSGYATYNQPQGQPQGGQYIGGGCGVAPSEDYADTPIEALDLVYSNL